MSRLRRLAPALFRPEGAALVIGIAVFVAWLVYRTVAPATATVEVTRYQGSDRYATAAELARQARPEGARSAILARGDDFADALAAAALVGPTDAVVLLTEANDLPQPTAATLEDLRVGIVYLMGGPAAISDVVRAELDDDYQVLRLSGANRFETAAAVARELGEREDVGVLEGRRTAFLVNGNSFPDALATASAAAAGAYPILLTGTDELPAATQTVLDQLDIGRVIVVGGSAAVGLSVRNTLARGDWLVEEIAGDDRAATAAAVADRFVSATLELDAEAAVLARGDAFADGLAAGSFAGTIGAPLLLAPNPDEPGSATLDFLRSRGQQGRLDDLFVVGGEQAVSPAVVEAARAAAATEPVTPSASPSDS